MPPADGCPRAGLAYPEVTRAICLVPSAWFSQAPWYALPVHLCRFRVRSIRWSYFPVRSQSPCNPVSTDNRSRTSLPAGPVIFNWFPSTTALALALGAGSPCADYPCAGTLGLSATVFLTLFVATHVSIRTSDTSRPGHPWPFTGLPNAPLPDRHQTTVIRHQTWQGICANPATCGQVPQTQSARCLPPWGRDNPSRGHSSTIAWPLQPIPKP